MDTRQIEDQIEGLAGTLNIASELLRGTLLKGIDEVRWTLCLHAAVTLLSSRSPNEALDWDAAFWKVRTIAQQLFEVKPQ